MGRGMVGGGEGWGRRLLAGKLRQACSGTAMALCQHSPRRIALNGGSCVNTQPPAAASPMTTLSARSAGSSMSRQAKSVLRSTSRTVALPCTMPAVWRGRGGRCGLEQEQCSQQGGGANMVQPVLHVPAAVAAAAAAAPLGQRTGRQRTGRQPRSPVKRLCTCTPVARPRRGASRLAGKPVSSA